MTLARTTETRTPRRSSLRRSLKRAASSNSLADTAPTGAQINQRTFGNRALMRAGARIARDAQELEAESNLRVGPADDHFEREADVVAANVVGGAQTLPDTAGGSLQRKEGGGGPDGGAVSEEFEQNLNATCGGGSALPKETLGAMNEGFGADFANVRVHNDAESDALNQSINARAFTSGSDIFFRSDEYNPQSKQGQQTLAHELTHVVQQGGASQRQVQRLIGAATFKKNTKLFGRKGKSAHDFADMTAALDMYHTGLSNASPQAKLKHLTSMLTAIDAWLTGRAPGKSSRRGHVESLRGEIVTEIKNVKSQLPKAKSTDFTDANVSKAEDGKYGEAMNTLDELTFDFGLDRTDEGEDVKVQGGSFTAVFKENLDKDPLTGKHRGAGIPAQDPEFAKRNLAMLEIDKLLGANVIPKTFLANHNKKEGFIMEKIEGDTAIALGKKDKGAFKDAMELPQVRRSLSTLYLLDMICAQVDRHPGNFVIEVVDGVIKGVKGIDNDLAFGKDVDLMKAMDYKAGSWARGSQTAGKLVDELKEIDRKFAQKIVDLTAKPNILVDALRGLLTATEIDKTLERLDQLADFLRPMLSNNDPILKTEWK